MIIDLHSHSSLSTKNGDSIKLESNFKALKIFKEHHVKVAAFSDHNYFLYKNYLESRNIANKMGILFLPAVELDVVRKNDDTGNIIVIFRDNLSLLDFKKLELIICKKTGKRKIRINKIKQLFSDFDKIIVPHVGKSNFCSYEDLLDIDFDAIEISNYNHPNYKSFNRKMQKNHKKTSIVAWSDTHHWNIYPKIKKLYTFIDKINSFDDLKNALKKNKDYIKKRLINNV